METINIVLSSNDIYTPYLATTIESIIENSCKSREYHFYVLHNSINVNNILTITEMVEKRKNCKVTFLDITNFTEGLNFYVGGKVGLTAETYYRLFIPAVLPETVKKVLYLDCDMVAEQDVGELFDTDISNYLFASAPDYGAIGKYYMGDQAQIDYWHSKLLLDDPEKYFCAGMLLINLDEFRKFPTEDIVALATKTKWEKHDQDVLNFLGNRRTLLVHPKWDVLKQFDEVIFCPDYLLKQIQEAEQDPCIIHYSSSYKPWNTGFLERADYFWKYAKNTPYFFLMLRNLKNSAYICYLLRKLFGKDAIKYIPAQNDILVKSNVIPFQITSISGNYTVIDDIHIFKNRINFTGHTMLCSFETEKDDLKIFLSNGNDKFECKILPGDYSEHYQNSPTYFGIGFECDVPIEKINGKSLFKVVAQYKKMEAIKKNYKYGIFCPIGLEYKNQFYNANKITLKACKDGILIEKGLSHRKSERLFRKEIKKTKSVEGKKALFVRSINKILKHTIFRKEIWLFSDRVNKADDSAEALLKYVLSLKNRKIKCYYALRHDSPDYERISKICKVVEPMSLRHKLVYLNTTFNISSQADTNTIYPFQERTRLYSDILANCHFVFLQHGIIKENMGATYNSINQNMKIFVTSTEPEYNSIINTPLYRLDSRIVKLTGLPRHDALYHDEKKIITLMPTWRKYLFQHDPTRMGVWIPRDTFQNSEYYKFYNNLINDKRVHEALEKYGYKLQFMPHPNVQGASKLFVTNKYVTMLPLTTLYSKIFAESKLVITDRSSAIMDFAYLRKPVLYCLFDDDNFMAGGHVYVKGYFDYERDGFGEVTKDYESSVQTLIDYIKNDCEPKQKYLDRMDKFFKFNDKNNSKRVYDEIVELRKIYNS